MANDIEQNLFPGLPPDIVVTLPGWVAHAMRDSGIENWSTETFRTFYNNLNSQMQKVEDSAKQVLE